MSKVLNNNGQTMIEIVGALGLLIVVIAAFTLTTANGLKNSQQAKNQTMAAQLAQDGIDKVRNIAKLNCYVSGGTQFWSTSFDTGYPFRISNANCTSSNPSDLGLTQWATDTSLTTPVDTDFTRVITISNATANTKKVEVKVSWSDSSGDHNSTVSTIIGNY